MNQPSNSTVSPATDAAEADAIDPRAILGRALDVTGTAIDAVRPDMLANPTPCTDMDVRTLLGHLVGVLARITALGNGADPFAVTESVVADDQWANTWAEACQRVTAAWSDDAVLDRTMTLPWVSGSGGEVLATYFSELTVHTWDLATATGQKPDWDDLVLDAALGARPILPAENRRAVFEEVSASMGLDEVAIPFAEAVPVADDAPAIERLVAWNGRNPLR